MTTETTDPRAAADQLGRAIFESLFPHGGPEKGAHEYDRKVPEEARLPLIMKQEDVQVDDIVLVVDGERWRSTLNRFSGLEALKSPGSWVGRVRKVNAKSIVVDRIRNPRHHSFSADLDDFGTPAFSAPAFSERLMFKHATREIGRVGTLEELREKIAAHPLLEKWRTARATALAVIADQDAKAKAARDAREARLKPVKAAIEGLNEIICEKLVELSFDDDVRAAAKWLEENDFDRMQVYIAGLHATGRTTEGQYAQAFRHLNTIIAYAKGEQ